MMHTACLKDGDTHATTFFLDSHYRKKRVPLVMLLRPTWPTDDASSSTHGRRGIEAVATVAANAKCLHWWSPLRAVLPCSNDEFPMRRTMCDAAKSQRVALGLFSAVQLFEVTCPLLATMQLLEGKQSEALPSHAHSLCKYPLPPNSKLSERVYVVCLPLCLFSGYRSWRWMRRWFSALSPGARGRRCNGEITVVVVPAALRRPALTRKVCAQHPKFNPCCLPRCYRHLRPLRRWTCIVAARHGSWSSSHAGQPGGGGNSCATHGHRVLERRRRERGCEIQNTAHLRR